MDESRGVYAMGFWFEVTGFTPFFDCQNKNSSDWWQNRVVRLDGVSSSSDGCSSLRICGLGILRVLRSFQVVGMIRSLYPLYPVVLLSLVRHLKCGT